MATDSGEGLKSRTDSIKCQQGCQAAVTCTRGCYNHFGQLAVSTKLTIYLSLNSVIPLLEVYPRQMKMALCNNA